MHDKDTVTNRSNPDIGGYMRRHFSRPTTVLYRSIAVGSAGLRLPRHRATVVASLRIVQSVNGLCPMKQSLYTARVTWRHLSTAVAVHTDVRRSV